MVGSLVYAAFSLVDLLIILRFIFLLLGANPINHFVFSIYNWSNPLVAPFNGIFGQHTVTTIHGFAAQGVFDWTALIALLVYGLIGGIIGKIV